MDERAYIDDLKTLRERAGIRVKKLAVDASVSENTVRAIEKHHGVMPTTASAVFNALNAHSFYRGNLDYESCVTTRSRFGVMDKLFLNTGREAGKGEQ